MGLISLENLIPLFSCPRCSTTINRDGQGYRCANKTCDFNAKPFRTVGKWPVLVDFAQSILVEQEVVASAAASLVVRREATGFKRLVMNMLFPPNAVAPRNIARAVELLKKSVAHPRILIIGGGAIGSGLDELYADPMLNLLSFDIYGSDAVQFIGDAHSIPLRDSSVDAVIVQAVLEHVLEPWRVVERIHRVLKDDGLVYAETPFMQQVHEGPYDFTRFSESGHRYLFKKFACLDSGLAGGTGTQLWWTIEAVLAGLFRSVRMGRYGMALFSWVRYLDRLIPTAFSIDNASGSFFLGRKTEVAMRPAEIVQHYKGAQKRSP